MNGAINRRKWDRGELEYQIGEASSETGQVFALYRRLLQLRRRQHAFHPDGAQRIIEVDERLFCFERFAPRDDQRILVLANLTSDNIFIDVAMLPDDLA